MKYYYINETDNSIERISDKLINILSEVYEVILADEIEIDSQDFILAALRSRRDSLINKTIWIHERHTSQKVKTIDNQKYSDFQDYWQELRDLPATANLTGVTLATLNSLFPTQPTL